MATSDYTSEIPYGYCHCGCGQKTTIATKTDTAQGWIKGVPHKYIRNHRARYSPKQQLDVFWSRVNKDGATPMHCPNLGQCWEWIAGCNQKGYGNFFFANSIQKSHRVSWIIANGEIPDDLWVLHKCDNPKCVRPDHLFLGTHQDNMTDKKLKGRCNNSPNNKKAE